MKIALVLPVGVAIVTLPVCAQTGAQVTAQTSQPDPHILQSILDELRAMHKDVRLSEATQILLTEWQLQQNTVNGVIQRRDNLRTELAQTQADEKLTKAEAARVEEDASKLILDPEQKRELADQEAHFRSTLANIKAREDLLANDLEQAETRLRNEQAPWTGSKASSTRYSKNFSRRPAPK